MHTTYWPSESARTVDVAAFSMLIHLHPECLFAIQSGPVGIHSHFADAAFQIPVVSLIYVHI